MLDGNESPNGCAIPLVALSRPSSSVNNSSLFSVRLELNLGLCNKDFSLVNDIFESLLL
jgi:hypothetical protein